MIIKEKTLERIISSKEVNKLIKNNIVSHEQECAYVLGLNAAMKLEYLELVGLGTLDQVSLDPRTVFRTAVLKNAKTIVMVHNHPSGNVLPSEADIRTATKLKNAGEILDIELIDSIVITADDYRSMKGEY